MHLPETITTTKPDEFELRFREHYLAADARQTRIAIAVWLVPVLFFAYPDYLIFGLSPAFTGLLTLRIAFCAFSLYTIGAMRKVVTVRDYEYVFLRWAAFAVCAVLLFNYSWAAFVPPNGAITMLILFSSYMVFPNRLSVRLIPPITLSIGNIVLQWQFIATASPYSLLTMFVAIVMVNVLGIVFSSSLHKHRRTEFKARLEETRIKEELHRLASTDDLTGIFNRRKLIQLASKEFERFRGENQPMSVLMIDIDHFKKLNDNFGHEIGDQILAKFTAYVAENIRVQNIWGRLGGEEFVLVLPGLPSEAAKSISEQLRQELKGKPMFAQLEAGAFTISIGLTEANAQDMSFSDVLKRADEALYKAKHNGRNQTAML